MTDVHRRNNPIIRNFLTERRRDALLFLSFYFSIFFVLLIISIKFLSLHVLRSTDFIFNKNLTESNEYICCRKGWTSAIFERYFNLQGAFRLLLSMNSTHPALWVLPAVYPELTFYHCWWWDECQWCKEGLAQHHQTGKDGYSTSAAASEYSADASYPFSQLNSGYQYLSSGSWYTWGFKGSFEQLSSFYLTFSTQMKPCNIPITYSWMWELFI